MKDANWGEHESVLKSKFKYYLRNIIQLHTEIKMIKLADNLGSYIIPIAVLGAVGYGYMWWKVI